MTDDRPNDDWTLRQVRDWLRPRTEGKGTRCPCCGQNARVYERSIYSTMARDLIKMYRAAETSWAHVPSTINARGGDLLKMRYWHLLEGQEAVRDDGSSRNGSWRITDKGVRYLLGQISVPKTARVYNDRCLELKGSPVTIYDALGRKFNYGDLMGPGGAA